MAIKSDFLSDNAAGEHPELTRVRETISSNSFPAYGNDPYTAEAKKIFKGFFGEKAETLFVYGGTGANIVALAPFLKPYQAVICATTSHIYIDECGGPEKFTGCKLIPIQTTDGKLHPSQIVSILSETIGIVHRVQPSIISISQPTELGTVYTLDEISELVHFAKENQLAVHIDGARLSNAAVYLNESFQSMTQDLGVDVVTFGGTKCGLAYGEAVIFFDPKKAEEASYIQKQVGQLPSKVRMISWPLAQLLEQDIWRKNASQANAMAQLLAKRLQEIPEITINYPVESNGVFCSLPTFMISWLKKDYEFVIWNQEISEIRLMTSYETQEEQVIKLVKTLPWVNKV